MTVSKEVSQAAGTVLYENILKMEARMHAASMTNAVWLINQSALPALRGMFLVAGTGGVPVYLPAQGAAGQPYGSLMGSR